MTTHRIPTSNGTACGICTAPATHMVSDDGWNGPACQLHADHAERAGAEVAPLASYELATKDASLGVGHVWTATKCPAYRTFNPADCICSVGGAATKPKDPDLVCPGCGEATDLTHWRYSWERGETYHI